MRFFSYTLQRYTDTIIDILTRENDELTHVNYYRAAAEIIQQSFNKRGKFVSYAVTHALIRDAVKATLETLENPKEFIERSYSRDIFEQFEPILLQHLKNKDFR